MLNTLANVSVRQRELFQGYLSELNKHIADLKKGNATRALEIRDLAALLHVHPIHLSNTIKEVSGKALATGTKKN